jgi:hypothetical protein
MSRFALTTYPGTVMATGRRGRHREMLDWLPESVQALGTVECSTFNGEFLQLDPDCQNEVIEPFAAEGIECYEDTENIVAQASGW